MIYYPHIDPKKHQFSEERNVQAPTHGRVYVREGIMRTLRAESLTTKPLCRF